MQERKFNSLIHVHNDCWAAEVLGMNYNENNGPDLIDDEKLVECKFALINPKKHKAVKSKDYPRAWTVQDHQTKYPEQEGLTGYWGFGFYELEVPVRSIRKDSADLEKFVIKRELYLVQWDWINQFPVHHTSGKTQISEWEYHFRYPKCSRLPEIKETYEVNKGLVHLTENVPIDRFNLDEKEVFLEGVPF